MKILPLLIAATVISSCGKNQLANQTTNNSTVSESVADTAKGTTATESTSSATQNNTAPVATTSNDGKPALNPAHGEPFHRCDISVGAPIDSAPQQAAVPQNAPQTPTSFNTNPISPAVTSSAAPVQATGPKPALNPAHGEPHHRCDLQVGAPLT